MRMNTKNTGSLDMLPLKNIQSKRETSLREKLCSHFAVCSSSFPVAVTIISLLQLLIFCFSASPSNSSLLLYRPDRRYQIWRFLFYMFVHAGWQHLAFNLIAQLIVGIPLEVTHGTLRALLVYIAGVLAGSLGTSVMDESAVLAGGSGGVYSMLTAHLAYTLLNFAEIELALLRLVGIICVGVIDISLTVSHKVSSTNYVPIGHVCHISAAIAGFLVGVGILRPSKSCQLLSWIAIFLFLLVVAGAMYKNVHEQ